VPGTQIRNKKSQNSVQTHLRHILFLSLPSDTCWHVTRVCVQADLIYMPFMERFATAMPAFMPYDPCDACDGRIGEWLAAMRQLECCQMAALDQKLFLQALK